MKEFIERVKLAWRIVRGRDGEMVKHTQRELDFAGYFDGDRMSALAAAGAVDLVRVFSLQGHSGFSASFMRHLFDKAAAFEPLGPLTGADSEWHQPADGVWQNRRCSHVFRQADRFDGQPYDLNAVVFEEPNGSRFTGRHSMRPIAFPYTPRSVVVEIPEEATDVQREMLAAQAWAAA